jgi:GT2 family glycosyltransferase
MSADLPLVSVVVPARNEEASITDCLQSLVTQEGVSFEVLLVDDASTDRTRELAGSVPGVQLIAADPLPPGWSGKNSAAAKGARLARGAWLLFTDADTVHRPGSLRGAVAEAEGNAADLLSYSPGQIVHGLWQWALMPVVFAELETAFPTSPPASAVPSEDVLAGAAANGQYLLVRRDAYTAVGGHASVAAELLEDLPLARRLASAGYRLRFRQAPEAVQTRMYRGAADMVEGWSRNLAPLFPRPAGIAVRRGLEGLALLVGPPLALALGWGGHRSLAALLAGATAIVFAGLWLRIRRTQLTPAAALLGGLGLPLFVWLLLRSHTRHRRGQVRWKGRVYAGGSAR